MHVKLVVLEGILASVSNVDVEYGCNGRFGGLGGQCVKKLRI